MTYAENILPNQPLGILCRNLYLGADFNELFPRGENPRRSAPLGEIVEHFYGLVKVTRFNERAALIAREIAQRDPHVVCLQEVFQYQVLDPDTGESTAAMDEDFLRILLSALAVLGVNYRIANIAPASDVLLPLSWKGKDKLLRIYDRDVILVRAGAGIDVQADGYVQYKARVTYDLPNDRHDERRPVSFIRACGWVQISWCGKRARVYNTHLESVSDDIQEDQAKELIASLAPVACPVVIVGDLNAEPGSRTYMKFRKAGLGDPFEAEDKKTYGAKKDRLDLPMDLTDRIDHIFTKGFTASDPERFGDNPKDRTPSPKLWPSDHAGLTVRLTL